MGYRTSEERLARERWAIELRSGALVLLMLALAGGLLHTLLGPIGLLIALTIVIGFGMAQLSLPPWLTLRLAGARPLAPHEAPRLYAIIDALSARAGIETPTLHLLPGGEANALATGGATGGALGVTRGLLRLLDERELAGVLAHEVAHLQHRDTLLLQLAAGVGRSVLMVLQFSFLLAVLLLPFGGSFGPVLLTLVALWLLPPLLAALQSSLSRTRELAADAAAARLLGSPAPLASALLRLQQARRGLFGRLFARPLLPPWLASHPSTQERVERLMAFAEPIRVPPRRAPRLVFALR